jgi:hypothetical protein
VQYAKIVITPEYGISYEDLLIAVGIEDIMTENNSEDLLTETNDNGPVDPYTYNTVITEYPNA